MTENEFLLFDRLTKIRTTLCGISDEQICISYNGGKDSCVLSELVDIAIPGNKIKRVYVDTGIELELIKSFVLDKKAHDNRFIIIKPTKNIKMKEEPLKRYIEDNKIIMNLVGIMREEGGRRFKAQCLKRISKNLYNFQPLAPITKEWEEWFIKEHNITISPLYTEYRRIGYRLKK